MPSLTIYILDDEGKLDHQRIGDIDSLMLAVDVENYEYTLQPPPASNMYWYGNQWNNEPRN